MPLLLKGISHWTDTPEVMNLLGIFLYLHIQSDGEFLSYFHFVDAITLREFLHNGPVCLNLKYFFIKNQSFKKKHLFENQFEFVYSN